VTDVRSVLAHRDFRLLLVGRTIALLGNGLAAIALTFAALDLGGSATELGVVLAARSIPMVAFLLFGGVVADRFPRHRVLVVSNIVSAASQAAAAALLLTDAGSILALVPLVAVNGAASAFTFPASAGLLPRLVPAALLQPANVVFRMSSQAAMFAGASLGGVLVATAGSGWGLAGDAASFAVAAACFAAIRPPRDDRADDDQPPASNMLVELREGWSAFRSRTWLWVVVVAFGVINALHSAGWFTLGPTIADQSFGRQGWGFVLAAETAGMVLAGVLLLRVRFRRPLLVGMLGVLAWSPLMLALAAEPPVLGLVAASFVAGASIELFGLGWDLSMQQHVPPDLLSRVYAYDALGSLVAIPLGQLLAGPAAALLGTREALVLCSVSITVLGAAALAVPAVRRLERTDLPEPAADGS
jgi:Major Facilitator Superfamily